MTTVHIVTRHLGEPPQNLKACEASIAGLKGDIRWFVVGPDTHTSQGLNCIHIPTGCRQGDYGTLLNAYLDCVRDEGQWVYVLDADNLMHPNFMEAFEETDNRTGLVVFSQELGLCSIERRHAHPDKLWVQHVDVGQWVAKRSFIGDLRFWSVYRNDGYFLMELVIRAREQGIGVSVIDRVLSLYNAQR